MANSLKILDLLKWYTDEEHPITQERLRMIPGADECMGYKTTFKKHLFSIADTYNVGNEKKDWRIVFPGYSSDAFPKTPSERHYTGPIYYNHEVKRYELDFLIQEIQCSNILTFEEKESLSKRLILLLGSIHYDTPTQQNTSQLISFSTERNEIQKENLLFIRNAISNGEMISFRMAKLNKNHQLSPYSETLMVSPYLIIFSKGTYWLIGNCRIGRRKSYFGDYIKYSNTLDIFRLDRITNLDFARESYKKKSKYFLSKKNIRDFCQNTLIYRQGAKIPTKKISSEYGKIEFEILWDNFSSEQQNDYSFLHDTFGDKYFVRQEKTMTIACIQAEEECFIDWAMTYIDKIRILDTDTSSTEIKKKLKKRLCTALSLLGD